MTTCRQRILFALLLSLTSVGLAAPPEFEMPVYPQTAAESSFGPEGFEVLYRGNLYSGLARSLLPRRGGGIRIWGTGYYDTSKIEPTDFGEIDSDLWGAILGIELKSNQRVLGAYYHYGSNSQNWNELFQGDTTNNLIGLTYHKVLSAAHLSINANGGIDKYDLRSPAFGDLSLDGQQANVYGEFGLDLPLGCFGVKPFAGVHYHFLRHDEATIEDEILESESFDGLKSLLGLRVNLKLGILTLQARASWVHEFLDESPTYFSYFSVNPGLSTPVQWSYAGETGREWFWYGTGLKLSIGNLKLFADYDLMLNEMQSSHLFNLGFCIGW